jgi:hypothetical protein
MYTLSLHDSLPIFHGTKNKDSSGETKKIYTGEVERLVRLED